MVLGEVTKILMRWRNGDSTARNDLFDTIYVDLRQRAGGMLRGMGPRKPLQPTELVNEAFLKLAGGQDVGWQDRNHFLAIASTVMRQVLVDIYRQTQAQKRAKESVTLATEHLADTIVPIEFEDLERALTDLAVIDLQLATVVELKFFAGMTNAEVAESMQQSESTVKRNWRTAKAWLLNRLNSHAVSPSGSI